MAPQSLQVRAEWAQRQGLGACTSLPDAASRAWQYQTGGTGAYLGLRARFPGLTRESVDVAVASGELEIVTGVRGCTFLVPAAESGWARAAYAVHVAQSLPGLVALGLDLTKLAALGEELVAACETPLEPAKIRGTVSQVQAIEAKKFGLSNTLPLALRIAESTGRLTRLPHHGRLDDERYVWRSTGAPAQPPAAARIVPELLARFVGWRAPVTAAEVAVWFDVSQGLARAALLTAPAMYQPIVSPIQAGQLHFLPFRDPFVEGRTASLVGADAAQIRVDGWGKHPVELGGQSTVHHHVVVQGAEIIGLWEWSDRLETRFFGAPPPGAAAAVDTMDTWIREQLGDVFIYAQDGEVQRARRLAVIRG